MDKVNESLVYLLISQNHKSIKLMAKIKAFKTVFVIFKTIKHFLLVIQIPLYILLFGHVQAAHS